MSEEESEGEDSVSSDLRSDISFMERQKDLLTLYRGFRSAMETIEDIDHRGSQNEQNDEYNDAKFDDSSDGETTSRQVELILEEISFMQGEAEEILSILSRPKFKENERVQNLKKELNYLMRVHSSLQERASAILDTI